MNNFGLNLSRIKSLLIRIDHMHAVRLANKTFSAANTQRMLASFVCVVYIKSVFLFTSPVSNKAIIENSVCMSNKIWCRT